MRTLLALLFLAELVEGWMLGLEWDEDELLLLKFMMAKLDLLLLEEDCEHWSLLFFVLSTQIIPDAAGEPLVVRAAYDV